MALSGVLRIGSGLRIHAPASGWLLDLTQAGSLRAPRRPRHHLGREGRLRLNLLGPLDAAPLGFTRGAPLGEVGPAVAGPERDLT